MIFITFNREVHLFENFWTFKTLNIIYMFRKLYKNTKTDCGNI